MEMKKTLYVSDLDETLLLSNETISEFTVNALHSLIERGMIFSYATARSYHTARAVTKGLSPRLPVIVYNGTFILENGTQRKLLSNQFTPQQANRILDILIENGQYPLVHSFVDGTEYFFYHIDHISKGMQKHLDRRKNDPRAYPVTDTAMLYQGEIFCITCIDDAEKLTPLHEILQDEFQSMFFKDVYTQEQWLELHPKNATKANAILELKRMLGCDKIVCFGNGKNDISMFRIADECYAVENAVDELKQIATGIIGPNDEDSVAKWLLEHYQS